MAYGKVTVKADDIFNPKIIYICQTPGCGADISEFPAAEKSIAPKHCKVCQNPLARKEIQQEHEAITKGKTE